MTDMKFDIVGNDRQTSTMLLKVATLLEKVADKVDKLDRAQANPRVDLDGGAQTIAQLDNIDRKRRDINGSKATVKVDTDKSLTSTINELARLGGSLQTLALPASLLMATPQVASLGAATLQLTGALALVPAAGAAAAGALAAVGVGMHGIADALGPRDTPAQIEKVDKALAELAPSARALVGELRSMEPAWSRLRLDVQEQLFAGTSRQVDQLGRQYLPILRSGLAGTAAELNRSGDELVAWARRGETARDVSTIFWNTRDALRAAAPAGANFASALTTITTVGSQDLPELAGGLTTASARFKAFIEQARQSGQLAEWIDTGIARLSELGSIAGNAGGILIRVFDAAEESGADLLARVDDLTGEVRDFLDSPEGHGALLDFFDAVGDSADNLDPALQALGRTAMALLGDVGDVAPRAATAISETTEAVEPLVVGAGDLARILVGPLLTGLAGIAPVAAPAAAGILALVAASKGMNVVQGVLGSVASRMSDAALSAGVFTEKATGSANAGQAVATAGDRMSGVVRGAAGALPALGAALAVVAWQYDINRSKSDEYADAVLRGSMSIDAAIAEETKTIKDRSAIGALLSGTLMAAGDQAESARIATENLTHSLQEQMSTALDPITRAQAAATLGQLNYNQMVDRYGPTSGMAIAAAASWEQATRRVEDAQRAAAEATKSQTDRLLEQQNQALAASNADVAYRQALLDRKKAQQDAAAATRDHGAKSDEAAQANLRLEQAELRVIDSAGRLGLQNSSLTSEQDRAKWSSDLQTNAILALASSVEGRGSPQLVDMTRKMSDSQLAAHNAMVETSGLDFTVRNLPDGRKVNVWTDDAVKAANDTATLHQRVDDLPREKRTIIHADGSFSVGGARGFADGGVYPGYTPGRDIGYIGISGGEAIMRPEWTRAVGSGYVDAANSAARAGGVDGVRRFLGGHAGGGVVKGGYGRYMGAYAAGGVVETSGTRDYAPDIVPATEAAIDYLMAQEMARQLSEAGGDGLAWARSQVGKPYVWGAVGPGGYDCSGFISAIVNVMRGRPPHTRVGTTASFPWPGFILGSGPGLNVGAFKGNPGHMAGTIAGVNVESAGGVGVRVGGPVGAASSMFNVRAYLPATGVGAVTGGGAGGSGSYTSTVLSALRILGQPVSLLSTVLRRMQQESGGNPLAVNTWDSNARAGTPSVGLMQVIGPTYRAYAMPGYDMGPYVAGVSTNPLANVLASMRYAIARYGSLGAAYNRAGGYANGAIIDRPTVGLVGEAGPEVILPLNRPDRAASLARRAGLGGLGGANVRIDHLEVHKTADVDEVIDRLNTALAGIG